MPADTTLLTVSVTGQELAYEASMQVRCKAEQPLAAYAATAQRNIPTTVISDQEFGSNEAKMTFMGSFSSAHGRLSRNYKCFRTRG